MRLFTKKSRKPPTRSGTPSLNPLSGQRAGSRFPPPHWNYEWGAGYHEEPFPIMSRGATSDSRREILRTAARLFQERGYDATSMQDIASRMNFSKAALYHHFESKEEILSQIMSYGMDVFEEKVLVVVRAIADPEQRLRACIRLHVELVLSGRDREITVILHENRTLPPEAGRLLNVRKKNYVNYLRELIAEVQRRRGLTRPGVDPRTATFALLGMINWMYQWYNPEGALKEPDIAAQYTALFLTGIFGS